MNEPRSITCPRCGMTSWNPNDVRERYCVNCHAYHDDMPSAEPGSAAPSVASAARVNVAVTQVPGHPGDVCVDEAACFVEFRRREGWDALARLTDDDKRGTT